MSRIQHTRDEIVTVALDGAGLRATFDKAELAGSLYPLQQGHYRCRLTRNDDSLDVIFRLLPGGQTMLVYLSDEPMHQITFTRIGRLRRPAPARKPVAETPPSPKPAPQPEPATPDDGRPTFFGI